MYRALHRHYPPPRKMSWWEKHPALLIVGVLLWLGAIAAFWKVLLVLAVLAGFGCGLYPATPAKITAMSGI